MDSQKFEMYALVELFGHQKIAGLVRLALAGASAGDADFYDDDDEEL